VSISLKFSARQRVVPLTENSMRIKSSMMLTVSTFSTLLSAALSNMLCEDFIRSFPVFVYYMGVVVSPKLLSKVKNSACMICTQFDNGIDMQK
jgi:hypothetical protein